jgi:hypothetical protein
VGSECLILNSCRLQYLKNGSVTCNCTISVLPFHRHNFSFLGTSINSQSDNEDLDFDTIDEHHKALQERSYQLRLLHINTQSMVPHLMNYL